MTTETPAGRVESPDSNPPGPAGRVVVIASSGVETTCYCGAVRDPLYVCTRCGR